MANDITSYLEQIKTASLGEEVRGSIYESIKLCYDDSHGYGIGSKDLDARHKYDVLIARNSGNLSETQLYPQDPTAEADLHYEDTTNYFTLYLPSETTMDDYDYIGVYYRVVASAAAELFLFKRSEFTERPSVVNGIFVTQGVGQLRKIHINPKPEDNPNKTIYYINLATYFDANTHQNHHVDSAQVDDSGKLAGVVTRISGFNFRTNNEELEESHGINPDTGQPYQSLGARLDAMEELIGSIGSGGLSEQAKTLLMSNLRIALYKEDASQSLDDLEDALRDGGGDDPSNYTITNNLTNVTNSNSARRIAEGESYTGQLTSTTTAPISSVIVTMGGTDITASAYNSSTRTITINSVTGNIVITASAPGGGGGGDDDWTSGVPYSGITWESGSLNFSTGEVVENASYKVSGFIPCHGASALNYSGLGANNGRSVVYYNTNHEFISSPAVLPSSNQLPVIVPTSAYFFRTIKANSQTNEVITPYLYQTATENTAWHDGERFLANGGMFLCYGASTLQCGYNARTYYYFYDAEKNLIDSIIRQNDATAITIPSGSYYCKIANGDSRYWAQLFA